MNLIEEKKVIGRKRRIKALTLEHHIILEAKPLDDGEQILLHPLGFHQQSVGEVVVVAPLLVISGEDEEVIDIKE